jgi:hypothetical protein
VRDEDEEENVERYLTFHYVICNPFIVIYLNKHHRCFLNTLGTASGTSSSSLLGRFIVRNLVDDKNPPQLGAFIRRVMSYRTIERQTYYRIFYGEDGDSEDLTYSQVTEYLR